MPLWIPPIIAFLVGSVPFGLLIAKAKGINIREHGSGNIGATNVLRVVGKKYGITCLFLDLLKGLIPTIAGISLITYAGSTNPMSFEFLSAYAQELPRSEAQVMHIITALATILGHNYSPWIGFKGGKGIATSAGALIALMPAGVLLLILVWLILFYTTKYVSVASIGAALSLPVIMIVGSWYHGKLTSGNWNMPLFFFSIIIAALATWRHRSNISNLRKGTEHKFTKK